MLTAKCGGGVNRDQIIQRLIRDVEAIRSDLALLEAGHFRVTANDQDITRDWAEQQRRIIANLIRLIEAYERGDP